MDVSTWIFDYLTTIRRGNQPQIRPIIKLFLNNDTRSSYSPKFAGQVPENLQNIVTGTQYEKLIFLLIEFSLENYCFANFIYQQNHQTRPI